MAFTYDDIESNRFFIELQTKYAAKYKEAQQNLWLICVPWQKNLKGISITKEFVDKHVLKPSPFFKSHYVTTDTNNTMSFEVEDMFIKTTSGNIQILLEEKAYNENYKPYIILMIDRPLCCFPKTKEESLFINSTGKRHVLSLNECTDLLESYSEGKNCLALLDKKLRVFNSSYMVLSQYLQDAAAKLYSIFKWTLEEFCKSLQFSLPDRYSKAELSTVLENYIMYHVHDKVFPVIKKFCLEDDKKITEKLLSLYEANATPDQLGVAEAFCCQTPSAVVELASLNSRCSPVEKLQCLMTTLELLNQDIEKYLNETYCIVSSNKDMPHLTSDDLIPLLVNVIVQARPQYFASNLYYIQNFCWEMSSIDKFSFSLVTFQAAKEFLKTQEFSFLKPSTRKVKKELSLEELMEATVQLQNNPKESSELKPVSNQSPLDHQLENVTKMIEASTRELHEVTQPKAPFSYKKDKKETKVKPEENLGDFINSLRQKSLGLTYGKQT